jgi:hypothetical protein
MAPVAYTTVYLREFMPQEGMRQAWLAFYATRARRAVGARLQSEPVARLGLFEQGVCAATTADRV